MISPPSDTALITPDFHHHSNPSSMKQTPFPTAFHKVSDSSQRHGPHKFRPPSDYEYRAVIRTTCCCPFLLARRKGGCDTPQKRALPNKSNNPCRVPILFTIFHILFVLTFFGVVYLTSPRFSTLNIFASTFSEPVSNTFLLVSFSCRQHYEILIPVVQKVIFFVIRFRFGDLSSPV
jgi:hypothetical protein